MIDIFIPFSWDLLQQSVLVFDRVDVVHFISSLKVIMILKYKTFSHLLNLRPNSKIFCSNLLFQHTQTDLI